MIPDSALFELTDVRFRHVLKVDHLVIPPHAVTCLVGASGGGKSTLLRMLNRMITPDSGTIRYRDTSLETISPVELRRRVVMLPQNPVMFEGSLRENVLIGRVYSGRAPIGDDRIRELLELVKIDKDIDGGTGRLSGGERQRVAIARVLAMQPEVLLLDEPSSALDAATQDDVIANVIAESRRTNTEVIMVTHAVAVAERWADRCIEIRAGEVVADG